VYGKKISFGLLRIANAMHHWVFSDGQVESAPSLLLRCRRASTAAHFSERRPDGLISSGVRPSLPVRRVPRRGCLDPIAHRLGHEPKLARGHNRSTSRNRLILELSRLLLLFEALLSPRCL
jgi:hypothetical protein